MIMHEIEMKLVLESVYFETSKEVASGKIVNLVNTINYICSNREKMLINLFKMYNYKKSSKNIDIALIMATNINRDMFERKALIFILKDKYERNGLDIPRPLKVAYEYY